MTGPSTEVVELQRQLASVQAVRLALSYLHFFVFACIGRSDCLFPQSLDGTADIISQLKGEVSHYRKHAFVSGAIAGQPVPPPPMLDLSHCSGRGRSRATSRAPFGGSVCQSPRPPVVPPSVPEGEGESAP